MSCPIYVYFYHSRLISYIWRLPVGFFSTLLGTLHSIQFRQISFSSNSHPLLPFHSLRTLQLIYYPTMFLINRLHHLPFSDTAVGFKFSQSVNNEGKYHGHGFAEGLSFYSHCLNAAHPSGYGEDRGQQNDTFFALFRTRIKSNFRRVVPCSILVDMVPREVFSALVFTTNPWHSNPGPIFLRRFSTLGAQTFDKQFDQVKYLILIFGRS